MSSIKRFMEREFRVPKGYGGKDVCVDSWKACRAFDTCDNEIIKNRVIEYLRGWCEFNQKYTWIYSIDKAGDEPGRCSRHFTIKKRC